MTSSDGMDEPEDFPEGVQKKSASRFSIVWLVPLVALIIGSWLVYKTIREVGPTIEIHFASADGIEAGKTQIKYRDIEIGRVDNVSLAPKGSGVIIEAKLIAGSKSRISDTARFWVVRPRIGLSGVSGISTLLSGAYIALDPGKGGKFTQRFVGLEEPPKLLSGRNGTLFRLEAERLGSLDLGSPVYFRDIRVGDVVRYSISDNYDRVEIEVFVDAPHDKFIYNSTKFWNVSGANLTLDAEGINFEIGSVVSLLLGGVAFHNPPSIGKKVRAKSGRQFFFYDSKKRSEESPITRSIPYLVYFQDSVRGLSEGAAVEYRGIRVGTVKSIRMTRDITAGQIRIGALLLIEPDRLSYNRQLTLDKIRQNSKEIVEKLVSRGMRAQLKTGNLLTGQLFVDFALFPNAAPAKIELQNGISVLPSIPGTLASITDSVSAILTKLDKFPIEEIGMHATQAVAGVDLLINSVEIKNFLKEINASVIQAKTLLTTLEESAAPISSIAKQTSAFLEKLNQFPIDEIGQLTARTVKGIDQVVNGGEIKRLLKEVNATILQAKELLTVLNMGATPLIKSATKLSENAQATLDRARSLAEQAEKTVVEIGRLASGQGPIASELLDTLQQVSAAARSLRILADLLERNPEALIRGKSAAN